MNEEFNDIAPYDDSQFHERMAHLVKEPGFVNALRFVMPDADYEEVKKNLLKIKSKDEFQQTIMFDMLIIA